MKPDATKHNLDPEHTRELLAQIEETTDLTTTAQIAERIGIESRNLRHYKAGSRDIPYPEQYCLECLAEEDTP